ncbi:MAG: hypothetical protein KC503_34825 [Myxococcales bacterium]|nr:hypothetical protein [Myxococcales bacterium]
MLPRRALTTAIIVLSAPALGARAIAQPTAAQPRADETRAAALVARGIALFADAEFARSRAVLAQALDVARSSRLKARARLYIGLDHAAENQPDKARAAFRAALLLDRSLDIDARQHKPGVVSLFRRTRAALPPAPTRATSLPPAVSPTAVSPTAVRPTTAAHAAAPRRDEPPRAARVWTMVAAGVAAASFVAAVAVGVTLENDRDEACSLLVADTDDCAGRSRLLDAADRARYEALHRRIGAKRTATNVLWVAGGVLAAAAAVLFWGEPRWRAPAASASKTSIYLAPSPLGLVIGLRR